LGQGIVWFFLLIHGGLGLVFGPIGLAASALAGRAPSVAAVLLAVPAAFLTVSWAPALFGGSDLGEVLVVLVLVPPAVVAAVVFARAPHHSWRTDLIVVPTSAQNSWNGCNRGDHPVLGRKRPYLTPPGIGTSCSWSISCFRSRRADI
jgi:hypothetical protein